ncbi:uncharacterized protein FFE2_08576 [Fusarium fujikuroi]|uniref:Uncharacterized protein n=1 Tax=Fusarium fujikuroi TaxID=5127 RepID=A0A9Q9RS15_FUSFU|nr:uncharacterized protein FFE2_08576 [Fusarium fujikuroi]VTT74586.1 unnamed protein product [Fusarium fujikuroi]
MNSTSMNQPTTGTGVGAVEVDMPMPGGDAQMRLIEACKGNASLYELYLRLPKLADDLESDPTMKKYGFSVADTVKALRKGNSWAMCELLHSIPSGAAKSIVRGTVAYDIEHGQFPCYETPVRNAVFKDQIPGVYVVSMSRFKMTPQGRDNLDGRFLNGKEIKMVIADINKYIDGYNVHVQFQKDLHNGRVTSIKDLSAPDAQALDHLKMVDGFAHVGSQWSCPVYIKKQSHIDKHRALVRTLTTMCTSDPTEIVRMKQGPLYVGCSKDLAKRTQVYNQNNIKDINKPLGLTLSILRKLDLDVKVNVSVVLRTWKGEQLAMAEQLVTTLAGSLVFQYGFNATESGGTGSQTVKSAESLRINTEYIMSLKQYMRDNLKGTLCELEQREIFLEILDQTQNDTRHIRDALVRCADKLKALPQNIRWSDKLDELKKLHARLQEDLKDREEKLKLLDLLLEIQQMVFEETGKPVIRLKRRYAASRT